MLSRAARALRSGWEFGGGRMGRLVVTVGTFHLFLTKCLAQAPGGGPQMDIGKSYVYSYSAVVLALALGLFLVCQPRNREESVESRMDLAFSE